MDRTAHRQSTLNIACVTFVICVSVWGFQTLEGIFKPNSSNNLFGGCV